MAGTLRASLVGSCQGAAPMGRHDFIKDSKRFSARLQPPLQAHPCPPTVVVILNEPLEDENSFSRDAARTVGP